MAMSKYQCSIGCAPNFAFALAQRKTPEEVRDMLDLSCVKVGLDPQPPSPLIAADKIPRIHW